MALITAKLKMVIKVRAFEMLEKVTVVRISHFNSHMVEGVSCHCLPTTWSSCADPVHNIWAGHSLLMFAFKTISFIFL
jgi:hypothetical protein